LKQVLKYTAAFAKWLILSVLIGVVGGILGSVFHMSVDGVTLFRESNPYIIYFLPLGGVVIALMYKYFGAKKKVDTNRVIESVRHNKKITLVMIPLIFVSTVITHLLGGSAGREGAALQLGGSLGYNLGRLFKIKKNNMHIIVMTGMSALFAALFGTPVTAAVFSLEVTTVGIFHYAGLFPCITSSITALFVAQRFGLHPVRYTEIDFGTFSHEGVAKVILLSLVCAFASILFCVAIGGAEKVAKRYVPNKTVRAFAGGVLIVALTLAVGTYDYNGAGMHVIENALAGGARPEAFALKTVFTAITIAAGFKGGEIVPAFFVGSTLGCAVAPLLGLNPGFAAAIGFVCLFCAVVNCPMASLFLSLEVFGAEGFLYFAIACSVSYLMSGNFSLYKSQRFAYSKTEDDGSDDTDAEPGSVNSAAE